MQDFSDIFSTMVYTACMKTGRPTDYPRTAFGERLVSTRVRAGLSQAQLADKVGVDRRVIAHWERRSVSVKPEQLVTLAQVLDVSADELLGVKTPRQSGPTGKVRQVFEDVSKLPRKQQLKVVEFVEAFVEKKAVNA